MIQCPIKINLEVGDEFALEGVGNYEIVEEDGLERDRYVVENTFTEEREVWHIDEFEDRIRSAGGALVRRKCE